MGPESNTNWNLKSNLPQLPAPYPPSALEFKWAQLIYESVSLRVAVKWQQDLWLRESHLLLLPLFQVSALWSAEYDALHLTFAEVPCWLRWYRICLQRMSPGFSSWVGKIPWRREWLPTPPFLPGEFHGQRSLVGYNPWGPNESDSTEQLIRQVQDYEGWKLSSLNHRKAWAYQRYTPKNQGSQFRC